VSAVPTTRDALLEAIAHGTARAWSESCRSDLAREGRAIEGGWPGTVSEARSLASADAARALAERSMPPLTYEELGRLATIAFSEARRAWQLLARVSARRPRARARTTPSGAA
jgi:hypothetical protein